MLATLVLTFLLHAAWNNRRDPIAGWFTASLLAMIVWAVGYCFEIMAVSLPGKVYFANLQYLGVATVSVFCWEVVKHYLRIRYVPKPITVIIWTVCALTIVFAFVNPGHVFRGSPYITADGAPLPVLHADYGIWYTWVFLPATFLINAISLGLLARAAWRAEREQRKLHILLFAALLLPLVGVAVYVLDLPPWRDYNTCPALFGVSGLLMALGLFRWHLFNLIPIAHDCIIEHLQDGVIIFDITGRILDLNPEAARIIGTERSKALGERAAEALSLLPALVDSISFEPFEAASTQTIAVESHGEARHLAVSSSTLRDRRGGFLGTTVTIHDITEPMNLLEQVKELANRDDLTGMANRRCFLEHASRELAEAEATNSPIALLLFDVDHFKRVNDTYGHRMGDQVLRDLAEVCNKTLRSTDVIGRMGGEEFAVLLPGTNLSQATETGNRLRKAVKSALALYQRDSSEPITISVGVAEIDTSGIADGESIDSWYERADRALYSAKGLGRDIVVTSYETGTLHIAET